MESLDLEKTNALLNLIKQQDDNDYCIIDKIYLYVKDPYEVKYQYLKKRKNNGLKNLKDPKAFIEYKGVYNVKISIKILKTTSQAEHLIY